MTNIEYLEHEAIDAALKSDFKKAIEVNKKILVLDKNNLTAHLRLGFSYLQMRNFEDAAKNYQKALKLQPGNKVATENLERLKILLSKNSKRKKQLNIVLDPNLFLEIQGRTKSVSLVNLGQKNTLAQLTTGQPCTLTVKKRKVEVRSLASEYIGSLPDDLSRRLLLFLKGKSKYDVFIKEVNVSRIVVFIKEISRGKSFSAYLSFPTNMQAQIAEMGHEKEGDDDKEAEEPSEIDLEKLAEHLTTEEKDYLPYHNEDNDDDNDD